MLRVLRLVVAERVGGQGAAGRFVGSRAESAVEGAALLRRIRLRDNIEVMSAIIRDPETMHGVPVFRGTRVPVRTFDYLEGGDTLEDFLEGFPTVTPELALAALEEAKELLLARA